MEENSKSPLKIRITKSLKRNFIFFIGWNQFIQGPILSSISPLLISNVIEGILNPNIPNKLLILWTIRIIAVLVFAFLIVISTYGLKLSTKVIYITSIFKWAILAIGIVIIMLKISSSGFDESLIRTKKITAKLIFSSTLLFIFAFAGIEDMAAMTKDVHFKNFRTILVIAICAVFFFYVFVYSIMLYLDETYINKHFYDYYGISLGTFGLILFIVGFISNDIGYKITQTVSTARKLVPISEDNLVHEMFSERNSKNEYKKAIIFVAIFTLISMVALSIIVLLIQNKGEVDYFNAIINMSCIALLIEDIFTFIISFILEKRRRYLKYRLERKWYIF
ncbi:amino acid permease [Mycoplasmopsis cynos]|uniref:amino acid permease n=1 Tax=Mycoplasmopsis cynos TaxID=171284 RepID=UPI00220292A7|nr:APC family permease [Mycoplasmopsis cynos]UWV81408.1 APC family permease [Mycoplasmopsis cynos]